MGVIGRSYNSAWSHRSVAYEGDLPEIATNPDWRRIMKAARSDHKFSQKELGRLVNTSQVVISQIESGEIGSSKFIKPICHELGIPTPDHMEDPESQTIVKVIHNASFERSVLQRSNIVIANVFDTLAASRRIRGKQVGGHSLAAVCHRELDRSLDKTQQTSDWTRRPLTGAQVNYAALDVEVLVELFAKFSAIQPELALG